MAFPYISQVYDLVICCLLQDDSFIFGLNLPSLALSVFDLTTLNPASRDDDHAARFYFLNSTDLEGL
jgi:hypothetical protein